MHALYKLKDMLCEELEAIGEEERLDARTLATVDTLAHALKNLDRVIMAKEEEMEGGSFDDGGSFRSYEGGSNQSYEGSYEGSNRGSYRSYDGYSGRRGRDRMGRFTSRRGYSRSEELAQKLKKMAEEAPDEKSKQEIMKLAKQMEHS